MNDGDGAIPSPEIESARIELRSRWELASVLNFVKVFESIIGNDLKISAEEIEQSLIIPDKRLRLLHVMLLKGIPPVSRNQNNPDAWVVTLSKKLLMWWPWVAEGDFPLTAAKGAEMATYKNLDPTVRLIILKALCEIRADQHDVVAYINDEVKVKKDISAFCKKNIGQDGKGTSYWLDGNETIGFRLYKEVKSTKGNETPPTMSYQWETLATNLDEFQKVVAEYSSSKSKVKVAVSAVVEKEAIPLLNKMFKKKQRETQKKLNEERILNNFSRSGITRSCRNRKPITYTFDEYDKVISNAIRESKKMPTKDEQKSVKKATAVHEDPPQDGEGKPTESDENDAYEETAEDSEENAGSEEGSGEESNEKVASEDSGEESDENDGSEDSGEESDENVASEDSGDESGENDEYKEKKNVKRNGDRSKEEETEEEETEEDTEDGQSDESDADSENNELEATNVAENEDNRKDNTSNAIKKNAEDDDRYVQEREHFGTKKRLVQRPNRNTALETAIVPDSEEETSSEDNSDE
ncbi:DDT domain-containing protein DDR4-like [Bidens hawaiensis]|uniref:DDT domain-containing protein DDR4-like n=1 Tax=Bidens hawaiensis TaxID=980011 RepID=UPI00404A9B39